MKIKNQIITDKNGVKWKEIISTIGTYYENEITGEIKYDKPEEGEGINIKKFNIYRSK